MLYTVKVSEALVREVKIEAATKDEAVEKVQQLYKKSEIVLDSSDFVGVKFSVK